MSRSSFDHGRPEGSDISEGKISTIKDPAALMAFSGSLCQVTGSILEGGGEQILGPLGQRSIFFFLIAVDTTKTSYITSY